MRMLYIFSIFSFLTVNAYAADLHCSAYSALETDASNVTDISIDTYYSTGNDFMARGKFGKGYINVVAKASENRISISCAPSALSRSSTVSSSGEASLTVMQDGKIVTIHCKLK